MQQPQPTHFWQVFWDIALWRRGPRDLPASLALLAFVAVVYTAVSTFQSYVAYGEGDALARALLDLGVTAVLFFVALAIPRRTHRYLQTLTAVLGCSALLGVPSLALLALKVAVGPGPIATLIAFATLPLLAWALLVVGHIVRQALDAPLITGMAVALTYAVVGYAVSLHFLPPPAPDVSVNAPSGS